ncbi:MAG: Gfo/Idh/MocA family oxidoreductase [Candidatus Nealsonbacteria bacterium]|nr:Gfo/Idh/MocA family oxidoreductase [Candidatus Nealsonbacteria bacterium]
MADKVNRRRFLEGAAAGGAGLAVATHIQAAEPSANEKLVVGVMGTGGRGTSLAKQFQSQPNTEVAYVCGVDQKRLTAAAAGVGKIAGKAPKAVGDFRRILDDKSVDVLVCAAPDHWHAPATILACAAGKHVYVEKPCCHNPREGELQVAAARKYRRVVQMGTQRRSYPGLIEAVAKLRDGAIGRLLFARAWYNNQRGSIGHGKEIAVPDGLDYDLWQGPAPRRPFRSNTLHYNWHWFWHWGTGEIGNNGVHGLDMARWAMDVDYPTRVTSAGGLYYFDDDQETPDSQVVTYEFGDKLITWECRNWHRRGFEGTMFGAAIYGDQGSLIMGSNDYKIYDRADKLVEESPGRGSDAAHIGNFLAAVRNGPSPNAEIEIGYKSTLLCHLGSIAHRTGHTLNCDPATGRIKDDKMAMGLWGREYEPGWEPEV